MASQAAPEPAPAELFRVDVHHLYDSSFVPEWETIAWTPRRTVADDICALYMSRDSVFDEARVLHKGVIVASYNQLTHTGNPVKITVEQLHAYLSQIGFTKTSAGQSGTMWTDTEGNRIGVPHWNDDPDSIAGVVQRLAALECLTFGDIVTRVCDRAASHGQPTSGT